MPSVLTLVLILLTHTMQVIRYSWMELTVLACPSPLVPHGAKELMPHLPWSCGRYRVKELAVPTCYGPVVQHGVKELMPHLLWSCGPTRH